MRLAEGQFFGESALQEGSELQKRQANVVSVGRTSLARIRREDFVRLLGSLTQAMNRNLNRKVLAGVALLSPLDDALKDQIVDAFAEETYPDGANIVTKGDQGKAFHIIKSGSAVVQASDDVTLGPSQYFGERSLLTGETVRSEGSCARDGASARRPDPGLSCPPTAGQCDRGSSRRHRDDVALQGDVSHSA